MKVTLKEIINATYHLFTFQKYTDMSRIMEITYGILAWIALGFIILPHIL